MQPFDALSLKAVLQEAKPLLLNKRVDKISQLGRDEILIGLRAKSGNIKYFSKRPLHIRAHLSGSNPKLRR